MKKIITSLLIVAMFLAIPVGHISAESTGPRATLLMDFETGQILSAQNIDQALPPASITKLMAMHLIFEALDDGRINLDDEIRASTNVMNIPSDASTIFLNAGEVLTVEDLLIAVATISANDAGIALAEHIAGSEQAFVNLMNQKAQELGMTNTNFVNSHGLDADGHVMSARDIAILSRETIKRYPEILEYSSIKHHRIERDTRHVRQGYFNMTSTFASLIGWRNVDGLKTGFTGNAGRSITVTGEENGRRYIAVVLGADSITHRENVVKELLNLGYDQHVAQVAFNAGDIIENIPVHLAKNREIPVTSAQDITLVMPRNLTLEDYKVEIELHPELTAPLTQGESAGTVSFFRDGQLVEQTELVFAKDVAKAGFFTRTLRFLSESFTQLGSWILDMFS